MAIQEKEASSDRCTVIGKSIVVDGKIEGDEDLAVLGRVNGTIAISGTLTVEGSGVVNADANARSVIVSGAVAGNITATESVQLTKDARMVGDINSPRVIIVEGAAYRGQIDMGELAEKEKKPVERSSRPQPTAAARSRFSASAPPRPPARPSIAAKQVAESKQGLIPPPPPPPPAPMAEEEEAEEPAVAFVGSGAGTVGKKTVVVKRKK